MEEQKVDNQIDQPINPEALADVVTCAAVGYREIELCVPVSVKPFADTDGAKVRCCGDPIIVSGDDDRCRGIPGITCDFNIVQRICVEVPVVFGAESEAGEARVVCYDASTEPCRNCFDPTDPIGPIEPIDPDDPTDPEDPIDA